MLNVISYTFAAMSGIFFLGGVAVLYGGKDH
ncbi:MAG: hypothetical protein EUB_01564 [Eubacterium sp.]